MWSSQKEYKSLNDCYATTLYWLEMSTTSPVLFFILDMIQFDCEMLLLSNVYNFTKRKLFSTASTYNLVFITHNLKSNYIVELCVVRLFSCVIVNLSLYSIHQLHLYQLLASI